ncbi:hypothetical protein pb186bvf_016075 [Paramecium bursaria]
MGCNPSVIDNEIKSNIEVNNSTIDQKKKKYINNPLAVKSMITHKQQDQIILEYSNINDDFYLKVQGPTPLDQQKNMRKEIKSKSILASSLITQSNPSSSKIQSKKVRFSPILDPCSKQKNNQKIKGKVSMETLEEIF